jgi:hypothetical protein
MIASMGLYTKKVENTYRTTPHATRNQELGLLSPADKSVGLL